MARDGKASQKLLLALLIALLGGFGAWNYRRNAAADEAVPRPFRSYAEADLGTLADAYERELDGYAKRLESASGGAVRVSGGRLLDEQIREFERVQRLSRTTRELTARIREHQASLGEIEREKRLRAEERQVWRHFLRRAFVYRG